MAFPLTGAYDLAEDQYGFIWIATPEGLSRFDGKRFFTLTHDPADSHSLPEGKVKCLLTDRDGFIWVGTEGGGLGLMDPTTYQFRTFLHDKEDENSISHNEILSLLQSQNGWIWIGTEYGLNAYDPENERFYRFMPETGLPGGLHEPSVLTLLEDSRGQIWLGSWNGGLKKLVWDFNPETFEEAYFLSWLP